MEFRFRHLPIQICEYLQQQNILLPLVFDLIECFTVKYIDHKISDMLYLVFNQVLEDFLLQKT